VFWLMTLDTGEVEYLSPAYEAIWGRTIESVYSAPQSWKDAVHPEDRDRVIRATLAGLTGAKYDEDYRIVRPDGTIRWIRDRAFPVYGPNEQMLRLAGVAEDITEHRQLEAQLLQAQKMEAVGQLAGGVAHDFNNLLTIITGYGELLLESFDEQDPLREFVDEIRKAGERSAALTRQLLAFSRKQVLAPRIIDLNAIVLDTEKMLRRVIGEDVELRTMLHSPLGTIRADPGQLEQVLLNLAVNARDAMPQGGVLTIVTKNIDVAEGSAAAHQGLSVGPYVMLEVTDSGAGMSEEVKRHLFEPFFTTKGAGKGTGLGLAVVHGFVKQSGGHVTVESEPGAGTSFRIFLSRLDRAHVADARTDATAVLPAGTETILLVEDEDGVRTFAKRVLERCGYRVLDATRSDGALLVAAAQTSDIHLLITDVVMPGGGGRSLADQVRTMHPEARVLYVSGYTDDAVVRHGVLHEQVNFLQKPFSPLALARKVRDVLAQ
jgi:two-component system cell cycle sensor histidine kinase/response regulator CckA